MKASSHFERKRDCRRWPVLLAVLLLAVFAFVQAVHVHPELGLADNAHCATCLAAHTPATIIAPAVLPAIVVSDVPLVLFQPILHASVERHLLYSRPPPPIA